MLEVVVDAAGQFHDLIREIVREIDCVISTCVMPRVRRPWNTATTSRALVGSRAEVGSSSSSTSGSMASARASNSSVTKRGKVRGPPGQRARIEAALAAPR